MKKLTRLLLLASLCCATGCDTDVPTEEVTEILTWDTRCMMSGGIPLAGNQAEQLRAMLSTPALKPQLSQILAAGFGKLGVEDVFYGTPEMIALYKYAYNNIAAEPKNENDWYCACGTELCDSSVGCFGTNNNLSCTALKVEQEGTCDPITVDTRYFGFILASHLLPIFRQVATLRTLAASAATDAGAKVKIANLIQSPNLINNLFKTDLGNLPVIENGENQGQLNFGEIIASLTKTDENSVKTKNAFYARLFYSSICECMNGSSGYCPDDMLIHVDGAHKSSTSGVAIGFYTMIREISVHLLRSIGKLSGHNNMTDAQLAASTDASIAKLVDEFIIDQVSMMMNSSQDLTQILSNSDIAALQDQMFDSNNPTAGYVKLDPSCTSADKMSCKIKLKPTDINNTTAKAILNALKNLLTSSYSRASADLPSYKAHRQFFGQFVVRGMSDEDRNNLFALTFSQNDRCIDNTSMAGHALGVKQYCHSSMFASGVFSFDKLANSVMVEGQAGLDNACYLADGIIMDDTFELKALDPNTGYVDENANLMDLSTQQVASIFNTIGTEKAMQIFKTVDLSELTTEQRNKLSSVLTNNEAMSSLLAEAKVSIKSLSLYLGDAVANNQMTINSVMKFPQTLPGKDLKVAIPMEGEWLTYRCPMGASCTVDGECGVCANSPVEHNYGGEYSHATCENGALVQPDTQPGPGPQGGCTNGDVRCKDGYLEKCEGGEYKHNEAYKCLNGCNTDNTACNNDYTCTEANAGKQTCFFDYLRGMLGSVMATCQEVEGTYMFAPTGFIPPCGEGATCNDDSTACVAPK